MTMSIIEHAPRLGRYQHVSGQFADVFGVYVEQLPPWSPPRAPAFIVFWRWVSHGNPRLVSVMPYRALLAPSWWESFRWVADSPEMVRVPLPRASS
jgi:hypothetical protein